MESFFSKFGQVEEVSAIMGKMEIATGDMVLQVILNRPAFERIPNLLKCRDKKMQVVVEGRKPFCWLCYAPGHVAKARPKKDTQPPRPSATTPATTQTKTTTAPEVVVKEKAPERGMEDS